MTGENLGVTDFRDGGPMAAVASWIRLWRIALGARNELAVSSPEEVARMPGALGVASWPNSAALLRRMLVALGLEPGAPAVMDHAVMDELQRLCASCEHKRECARDLADGTATENFYAYCPNARALDEIRVEMTFNRL